MSETPYDFRLNHLLHLIEIARLRRVPQAELHGLHRQAAEQAMRSAETHLSDGYGNASSAKRASLLFAEAAKHWAACDDLANARQAYECARGCAPTRAYRAWVEQLLADLPKDTPPST